MQKHPRVVIKKTSFKRLKLVPTAAMSAYQLGLLNKGREIKDFEYNSNVKSQKDELD